MATFAKEEVSRIINYSESLGLGPLSPSQAGGIIPMYGDPENPSNLNNRHTASGTPTDTSSLPQGALEGGTTVPLLSQVARAGAETAGAETASAERGSAY